MDNKDYLNRRLTSLKREQDSFRSHWMDLSKFIKPRRGRFFVSDRNKGEARYNNIINSVATKAHRTATAGMLAGTMSPARPWFALETHDTDLMEAKGVKEWLGHVEYTLRRIFNQSNFYGQATNLIGEMLQFGTGCMTWQPDFDDVMRFYCHTTGGYYIAQNERLQVDTMAREFEWQVKPLVERFGYDNCSRFVRDSWDKGNYDNWAKVNHVIEPNYDFKPNSPFAKNKQFRSVYYEPSEEEKGKMLSVSGFDTFPAFVSRWATTDEDVYGTDCPGMVALGDIKQLQTEERRKAQAIDKMVNPPLSGPSSLRNVDVNSLPGGLVLFDGGEGRQKLEAIYQVDPRLNELRADMDAIERRINEAFFVDLFLAISQMEGIQPRNELDLMQRNEERLLQLGPVLEHLHGELLERVIDTAFTRALSLGILPEAPEVLQGAPLKVKYISTLAMAQKAVATQGIEKLAMFAGQLAQLGYQDALMKFDAAQAIDEYSRAIGTPPSVVRSDDDVAEMQAQQAQQQALAAAMEAGKAGADMNQKAAAGEKLRADAKGGR